MYYVAAYEKEAVYIIWVEEGVGPFMIWNRRNTFKQALEKLNALPGTESAPTFLDAIIEWGSATKLPTLTVEETMALSEFFEALDWLEDMYQILLLPDEHPTEELLLKDEDFFKRLSFKVSNEGIKVFYDGKYLGHLWLLYQPD